MGEEASGGDRDLCPRRADGTVRRAGGDRRARRLPGVAGSELRDRRRLRHRRRLHALVKYQQDFWGPRETVALGGSNMRSTLQNMAALVGAAAIVTGGASVAEAQGKLDEVLSRGTLIVG